MSFEFEWPRFSADFYAQAATELTTALNKSDKPPNIARDIVVTDLDLGTVPPDLEILEVVELTHDRFRGIFRLSYAGDAFITLQTAVQANPIVDGQPLSVGSAMAGAGAMGMPAMVAANAPLIVPLQLKIAKLKLAGIASLVVDKFKGITLAFKNDPLENVTVSSTFDHMATIRRFLQSEIEKLLRKLFLEDIPSIVHNASLHYLQQNGGAGNASAPLSRNTSMAHAPDLNNTQLPVQPPAAWIEPKTGQPLLDEPLELEHEELVRLAKAIHQPPSSSSSSSSPSLRAPSSPGLATLLLSTLVNASPSKLASSASSSVAPSTATPPTRRDGLATVIDSDSDSDPAPSKNRLSSPTSSSSSPTLAPDPYSPLTTPDPRDDPGTLFGALGLLLPEWTSGTPSKPSPASPARVHRFNARYYAKHKRPASVLYAHSLSPAGAPHTGSDDAGSAVSLPAVLPSQQQRAGHAGSVALHRSHSHLLASASPSRRTSGASTAASGEGSRPGAGGLARTRSGSSTGLGRLASGGGGRGLGPIRSMSSMGSSSAMADSYSTTSAESNTSGQGGGGVAGNAFAAQLANLYSANQSLSPFSRYTEHSTFRSLPKRKHAHHAHEAGGRSGDDHGGLLSRTNSSLMSSAPSAGAGGGYVLGSGGTIITPAVSPTSSGAGHPVGLGYVTPRMVARRSRKAVRKRVFTMDLRPPKDPLVEAEAVGESDLDRATSGEEGGEDLDDELAPSASVSVVGAQHGGEDEDWAARFTDELLPSSSVSEVGVQARRDRLGAEVPSEHQRLGVREGKSRSRRRRSKVDCKV